MGLAGVPAGRPCVRILIVEDDRQVAEWLLRVLRGAGFQPHAAHTGESARRLAASADYDLALVDLGLPDMAGVSVVERFRHDGLKLPIIVLSGRSADQAVVAALDAGADDFVGKPVTGEVLLARVRAALRRGGATRTDELRMGDLVVDRVSHAVRAGGRQLPLTPREYHLLDHMLRHHDEVVSRSELLKRVWGLEFDPGTNVLEATMSRLRAKLPAGPGQPRIRTLRNAGYMLVLTEAAEAPPRAPEE